MVAQQISEGFRVEAVSMQQGTVAVLHAVVVWVSGVGPVLPLAAKSVRADGLGPWSVDNAEIVLRKEL